MRFKITLQGVYLTFNFPGAIGDADGDGTLDLMLIQNLEASVQDYENHHFIRAKNRVTIHKINLESDIKSSNTDSYIHVDAKLSPAMEKANTDEVKPMSEMKLRNFKDQPWTAYLGKNSDSIYRKSKT